MGLTWEAAGQALTCRASRRVVWLLRAAATTFPWDFRPSLSGHSVSRCAASSRIGHRTLGVVWPSAAAARTMGSESRSSWNLMPGCSLIPECSGFRCPGNRNVSGRGPRPHKATGVDSLSGPYRPRSWVGIRIAGLGPDGILGLETVQARPRTRRCIDQPWGFDSPAAACPAET